MLWVVLTESPFSSDLSAAAGLRATPDRVCVCVCESVSENHTFLSGPSEIEVESV